MLNIIIRFCVKEPWLVVALTFAISVAGWWAFTAVPIDAIPNVGENQVIVLTRWPGRSPKDIEDQVTYPLSVALLAVPGAESVRGKSMFGSSFLQVTFKDEIDFYWARSRVSEQLGSAASQLPEGVVPQLGPDATGLGQIYYYVLQPPESGKDLAELRSLQDFVIKYELRAVEGVSEVASIGGYVRQYQIDVDPDKLRFYEIPLDALAMAIEGSNLDVGAKTIESSGMEYIVRGKGFLGTNGGKEKAIADIEQTVILQRDGVPVRVGDVAQVQLGPDFRRGALDYNGAEAVGGVVVMRYGENPRVVIDRIKDKIAQIEPALKGVTIHGVYDRSELIDETMATLTHALRDQIIITAVVILLFLLHIRSSFVVAICLPAAVLMSFIAMYTVGVGSNIMSLAGIAIAIGTMVDMGIIVSENVYQHLAEWERQTAEAKQAPGKHARPTATRSQVVYDATIEVAPAVVTAVATTIISFLPVFFLTGRDYRLFSPLAYTKTFAIAAAMLTAVTLVPALSNLMLRSAGYRKRSAAVAALALSCLLAALSHFLWGGVLAEYLAVPKWAATLMVSLIGLLLGWHFFRERIRPIEEIPTSRFVRWIYAARLRHALNNKAFALSFPAALLLLGVGAFIGLPTLLRPVEKVASLFGADLNELPGYVDAKHIFTGLQSDDWIALDEGSWFYMPTLYPAASFSQAMQVLQTQDLLIGQIPEVKEVLGKIGRVESALDPAPTTMVETYVMLKPKDQWREGVTPRDIWDEINRVATLPGVTPASALQPIEGRVVMLQSGIKASMAIRIYGDELQTLAKAAFDVAAQLRKSNYVNSGTVNPDIVMGAPYIEFSVDREAASRYGMNAAMVNQVIEMALGGMNLITTVEGRERYPVRLRYDRDLRERIDQLGRLPVVTSSGAVVPLEELAKLEMDWGPGAINSENGRLVAHVAFMTNGVTGDLESVKAIEEELRLAQLPGGVAPHIKDSPIQDSQNGQAHSSQGHSGGQDASEMLSLTATGGGPAMAASLVLPTGYSLEAVGSFRNQIEANLRLMWIIPVVMLINLFVIYLEFRNLPISMAVFSGIPVAFAGGMVLVAWMEVELNTAVWVGFIALFGLAVDDGVVMATYIHQLLKKRKIKSVQDIRDTIYEAGLKRIRPCMMTTVTTLVALIPVLMATGRGADVARAMAIPVFGGMLAEPLTSFIVPTLYSAYLEFKMRFGFTDPLWEGTEEMPRIQAEEQTNAA